VILSATTESKNREEEREEEERREEGEKGEGERRNQNRRIRRRHSSSGILLGSEPSLPSSLSSSLSSSGSEVGGVGGVGDGVERVQRVGVSVGVGVGRRAVIEEGGVCPFRFHSFNDDILICSSNFILSVYWRSASAQYFF